MNATATDNSTQDTAAASAGSTKPRKVPDIGVALFLTFRPQGTNEFDFFPEPTKVTKGKDNRLTVTLGNIPLPPGVPAPSNALTALYGFRDHLDEMKLQYEMARKRKASLVKVDFKLQVGTDDPDTKIVLGTASLEDLPRSRFLNVLRLNQYLQEMLLSGVNKLLAEEAERSKKAAVYYERIVHAGARPDLLCEVVRRQPEFRHINSVVYSVPDGTPRGRKVCTIFDTENVIDYHVRGAEDAPFDLVLPKLKR